MWCKYDPFVVYWVGVYGMYGMDGVKRCNHVTKCGLRE